MKVYAYGVGQCSCVFVSSLHICFAQHTQCEKKNILESQFYDCTLRFVFVSHCHCCCCSNVFIFFIHSILFHSVCCCFCVVLFWQIKKAKQFYDRFFFEKCFFNIFLIGIVRKANFSMKKKQKKKKLNGRIYKQEARW